MAMEIDTEKGTVIYTDAFFRYANIEENIPIGVCQNWEAAFELTIVCENELTSSFRP